MKVDLFIHKYFANVKEIINWIIIHHYNICTSIMHWISAFNVHELVHSMFMKWSFISTRCTFEWNRFSARKMAVSNHLRRHYLYLSLDLKWERKRETVKEKREDNKKKMKREKERNASFEIDSKKYSFVWNRQRNH